MVARAWLIWGLIGSFKACKGIVGLLMVITWADGTEGATGIVSGTALIGAFLVLLFLGRLATGGSGARGSFGAAKRVCISKTLSSSAVSTCTSVGKGSPKLPGVGRGPYTLRIMIC